MSKQATKISLPTAVFGASVVNYISYGLWTLLNKHYFTAQQNAHLATPLTAAPLLSTSFQMFVAGGIAYIFVVVLSVQRSPSQELFSASVLREKILPLGFSRALDIGCGNYALSLVTVALQQVVKSTLPIFVTILTVVVLRKRVTAEMVASLLPIVVGTILATYGGEVSYASLTGVVLAFVSCFGRAFKAVLNALLLHGSKGSNSGKLQPLEIVLLEAPTTGLIILIPGLFIEAPGVLRGESLLFHDFSSVAGNLCLGVLMFVTQAAYVTLIDITSALTCQVLMSLKMLLLIFMSVWIFHTDFSLLNCVGVVVTGGGCVLYAMAASAEQRGVAHKKQDHLIRDDTLV